MPRDKAIETPDELEQLFEDYKIWAKSNPYKFHDYKGKDATEVWLKKERPITWIGFEGYLCRKKIVTQLTHYEQNTDGSYTAYLPIIRAIKREISSDIVDGALAGVYNQNIAARIEGLADKKEVDRKTTKVKFTDAG